jgi:hypothetical protein
MLDRRTLTLATALAFAATLAPARAADEVSHDDRLPYAIVDTMQVRCYDDRNEIRYPAAGNAFSGQDAEYAGREAKYRDLGDGTVLDLVTGLMWQKSPGEKRTWPEAVAGAAGCRTGGHDDWRLPTIKELYSLIEFKGLDVDPRSAGTKDAEPFLDTRYFDFSYGDPAKGERVIDSQWATSTKYAPGTMGGIETDFGVNFADGRIKGYGLHHPGVRGDKTFFVRYVRGNSAYGKNDFHDNGDGTVTDRATGLTWTKADSGGLRAGPKKDGRMNWSEALAWAEGLDFAGHDDWRLPNAKELQSIVDYARSPDATKSPAIDPVFETTKIRDEIGRDDYPYFWTSTTHASRRGGDTAVYVAFGRAGGWMSGPGGGEPRLLDVHGAGAQRSDPKSGDPAQFPHGRGPQGDVIRILNFVRCVRGGVAEPRSSGPEPRAAAANEGPEPGDGPMEGPPGRGAGSPGPHAFIERLDKDGDGKVSRAEFDGPPEHFREFDKNGDGFIDESEAPSGPPPNGPPPGGSPPGGRPPR